MARAVVLSTCSAPEVVKVRVPVCNGMNWFSFGSPAASAVNWLKGAPYEAKSTSLRFTPAYQNHWLSVVASFRK